jgi:uncharacterized membrane protein YiaA
MSTDPTTLTGAQLLEIAEAMKGTSRYTMRDERGKVISIIIVATGVYAAAVDHALEKAGLFIIETPQGH